MLGQAAIPVAAQPTAARIPPVWLTIVTSAFHRPHAPSARCAAALALALLLIVPAAHSANDSRCIVDAIAAAPDDMTVGELQAGFLKLGKQLYSAGETQARRRRFKRMLRTSPNFGPRKTSCELPLAA